MKAYHKTMFRKIFFNIRIFPLSIFISAFFSSTTLFYFVCYCISFKWVLFADCARGSNGTEAAAAINDELEMEGCDIYVCMYKNAEIFTYEVDFLRYFFFVPHHVAFIIIIISLTHPYRITSWLIIPISP